MSLFVKLDSMRSRKKMPHEDKPQRTNKMPHFFVFLFPVTLTFDLDIRTRAKFLYSVPNRQVS